MSQKISPRRVIGFNLGSLITFRFCKRVCRREIRFHTLIRGRSRHQDLCLSSIAHAVTRKSGSHASHLPLKRAHRDLDAAFDYLSSLWVDTRRSQWTNVVVCDNVRENIRPVTVSLGRKSPWKIPNFLGVRRWQEIQRKMGRTFRVKRSSRPPGIRVGDGGLAPKWLRKGRSCRHIRGFFRESKRAPSLG